MAELDLPDDIVQDIDLTFCYMDDKSYQERAHEYLETYEVPRGYRDTAVQVVVTDIARRAFMAGADGMTDDPVVSAELAADLLDAAAKCARAASSIGESVRKA